MSDILVAPPEADAKIHEVDGKLVLYVSKLTVALLATTVTPCRNITDKQLRELVAWAREAPSPEPERWRERPNGWVTYVSVPVDFDDAVARILAEAAADAE